MDGWVRVSCVGVVLILMGCAKGQEPAMPRSEPGAADEQPSFEQEPIVEQRGEPLRSRSAPLVTPQLGLTESGSPEFLSTFEDFLVAEQVVSLLSDGCSDACRALRSMVRAAERMCSIAATEGERHRCEDARDRVRTAKNRVRRACGVCTEGPLLED